VKTEMIKFSTGKEIEVMKENLSEGKKILIAEGYRQCANVLYMKNGNILAHYSKFHKAWVFEKSELGECT